MTTKVTLEYVGPGGEHEDLLLSGGAVRVSLGKTFEVTAEQARELEGNARFRPAGAPKKTLKTTGVEP